MKHYAVLIMAILLGVFNVSPAQISTKRMTTAFEPYLFIHQSSDSQLVHKLYAKAHPFLAEMETFFGAFSPATITIVLTRSEEEYYHAAKYGVPEWSQAVAFTRERLVIIKIADADQLLRSPQVLLHEIVHIHVEEYTQGAYIPAWLNEGLAQYFSGDLLTLPKKITLSNAINAKKILSLASLDTMMRFQKPKAELAYIQSVSAIEYIVEKYNKKSLLVLLNAFKNRYDIDKSLKLAFGVDFIDFEIDWYEYIYDEYRWLILLNFNNFLWFLITALIMLAILVVRWRNRKKLRHWEEEDKQLIYKENW